MGNGNEDGEAVAEKDGEKQVEEEAEKDGAKEAEKDGAKRLGQHLKYLFVEEAAKRGFMRSLAMRMK
ncbi:unnamed protein product [Brassica napus]|uniref:(rape) hypothetical protein n=1 Tax=Brassica napus TaxID=3708 RepID=A0A816KBG4_BRANA|nr:unnamed protein product [Brassica napus]